MRSIFFSFFVATIMLLGSSAAALAETRVALVIGNSAYRAAPRLNNPARDAVGVAEALRQAGFSITSVRLDADQADMRSSLQAFARAARGADVAAVYFAGHGLEMGGVNYLIPVDAKLAADSDVAYEAIPLDLVMDAVSGARRFGLVMLDACRNNPFAAQMSVRRGGQRSLGRGLARVEPVGNTLVVYAARDGTTATDGDANHSPFAQAVIKRLPTPGLEVGLAFRQVRDDVAAATGGVQQPFTYGSLGGDAFYFVGGPAAGGARPVATRPSIAARPASAPTAPQTLQSQIQPQIQAQPAPQPAAVSRVASPLSARREGVTMTLLSLVEQRGRSDDGRYVATVEFENANPTDLGVALLAGDGIKAQMFLTDGEGGDCELAANGESWGSLKAERLARNYDDSAFSTIAAGGSARHTIIFNFQRCRTLMTTREGLAINGSFLILRDGRRIQFPFSVRYLTLRAAAPR